MHGSTFNTGFRIPDQSPHTRAAAVPRGPRRRSGARLPGRTASCGGAPQACSRLTTAPSTCSSRTTSPWWRCSTCGRAPTSRIVWRRCWTLPGAWWTRAKWMPGPGEGFDEYTGSHACWGCMPGLAGAAWVMLVQADRSVNVLNWETFIAVRWLGVTAALHVQMSLLHVTQYPGGACIGPGIPCLRSLCVSCAPSH